MMNAIELLNKHEGTIKDKYGARKIGIFGSFAHGEGKEESDIDILVEFKEGLKTFDNYMDLKRPWGRIFHFDFKPLLIFLCPQKEGKPQADSD